jgi:Rab-like protein 3
MNDNEFKIKIIVLGDSSSGKSSLVNLICNSDELKKSSWTIGCSVDVKIHQFKDATKEHKQYIVEFWDIGGGIKSCTDIFYNNIDGCLLVHDLTNRRSYDNLINYYSNIEL